MDWLKDTVPSPFGSIITLHWAAANVAEPQPDVELESAEDELGAVLWNSNSAVLGFLNTEAQKQFPKCKPAQPLEGKSVLELGAGVGILGVGLAMAGGRSLITDLKELVPLMRRNIKLNDQEAQLLCSAEVLRWGDKNLSSKVLDWVKAGEQLTWIVMCDALYGNKKDWQRLLHDVKRLSCIGAQRASDRPLVYNFCEQRVEGVERDFVAMLEEQKSDWEVEHFPLEEKSGLGIAILATKFRYIGQHVAVEETFADDSRKQESRKRPRSPDAE